MTVLLRAKPSGESVRDRADIFFSVSCISFDETSNGEARHRTTNAVGFHLYEVPRGVEFSEMDSSVVAARG